MTMLAATAESKPAEEIALQDLGTQAIQKWVSALADQLKNPVAGIGAALQIIEKSVNAAADGEVLSVEVIQRALLLVRSRINELDAFVNELTGFAKPAQVFPEKIDLRIFLPRYIRELTEKLRYQISNFVYDDAEDLMVERSAITFDIAPGAEFLCADAWRLQSMLTALITNAFEAIPPDVEPQIHLRVAPEYDEQNNMTLVLSVEDNGSGIPVHARDAVVHPFYTAKEAGTGLGLSVVNKYIQAHHGHLEIHDRAGGGTTIALFFPQNSFNL